MSKQPHDPVPAAIDAAVSIAAEHGIRVGEARVLSHEQAVIVHLAPAPLGARVGVEAVFGPRLDWQRGAVGLAAHLAAAGAPVVPPSDLLPPGPHVRERAVLSFWSYVVEDRSLPPDPWAAGDGLRRIHELGVGYDGELANFWPLNEAELLLAGPEVTYIATRRDRTSPAAPSTGYAAA